MIYFSLWYQKRALQRFDLVLPLPSAIKKRLN